jgi:hypothetical protein
MAIDSYGKASTASRGVSAGDYDEQPEARPAALVQFRGGAPRVVTGRSPGMSTRPATGRFGCPRRRPERG